MALKPCRECGQQVSTAAEICPHCGIRSPAASNPLDTSKRRTSNRGGLLFFVLAIIIFLVWMGKSNKTDSPQSGASSTEQKAEQSRASVPDPLDTELRERSAMVGAVAVLSRVPPKCTIDNRAPTGEELARFMHYYGHTTALTDGFLKEVEAKMKENDQMIANLPEPTKSTVAEGICGFAVIYSEKVRKANREWRGN